MTDAAKLPANPFEGYKAEKATVATKKAPETVSQAKLRKYQDALTAIDKLEESIKKVKAEYGFDSLEKSIQVAAEFSAFEAGRLGAWFETGRRSVAWKQAFERLCEIEKRDAAADAVLVEAATAPGKKLVVGPLRGVEAAVEVATEEPASKA